jgi:hypothetical protein
VGSVRDFGVNALRIRSRSIQRFNRVGRAQQSSTEEEKCNVYDSSSAEWSSSRITTSSSSPGFGRQVGLQACTSNQAHDLEYCSHSDSHQHQQLKELTLFPRRLAGGQEQMSGFVARNVPCFLVFHLAAVQGNILVALCTKHLIC